MHSKNKIDRPLDRSLEHGQPTPRSSDARLKAAAFFTMRVRGHDNWQLPGQTSGFF
jgi:hypothetical protein